MASSTLVLPYGLPPAEMAPDLIRSLQAPSLASLLSRHSSHANHGFDADSRVLPHEAWLARALGLAGTDGAAPFAPAVMRKMKQEPAQELESGHWFLFHPVHVAVGTHLMMPDLRGLRITEDESRALFEAARTLFDQPGRTLVYGDAHTWFLRADDWSELATASPDAATGDNLHPWMPAGAASRDFRRVLNEVQMLWHAHPVNAERKMPVNSFWLWAGAPATQASPTLSLATTGVPGWLAALAAPELRETTAAAWLPHADRHPVVVAGQLVGAGIAEDWSYWLQLMMQLEEQWFTPLLEALRAGQLADVRLVLTNRHGWTDTHTTKLALNKFWRTPTLKNMLAPSS
jgi:hypothetical protein